MIRATTVAALLCAALGVISFAVPGSCDDKNDLKHATAHLNRSLNKASKSANRNVNKASKSANRDTNRASKSANRNLNRSSKSTNRDLNRASKNVNRKVPKEAHRESKDFNNTMQGHPGGDKGKKQ